MKHERHLQYNVRMTNARYAWGGEETNCLLRQLQNLPLQAYIMLLLRFHCVQFRTSVCMCIATVCGPEDASGGVPVEDKLGII